MNIMTFSLWTRPADCGAALFLISSVLRDYYDNPTKDESYASLTILPRRIVYDVCPRLCCFILDRRSMSRLIWPLFVNVFVSCCCCRSKHDACRPNFTDLLSCTNSTQVPLRTRILCVLFLARSPIDGRYDVRRSAHVLWTKGRASSSSRARAPRLLPRL